MEVFLGPMCVLYYFIYKNFLRRGRSESFARERTPISVAILLLWPIFWFITPFNFMYDFLAHKSGGVSSFQGQAIYLGLLFLVILVESSFLKRNHSAIIAEMSDIVLPNQRVLSCISLLFAVPLAMVAVGLSKYHFLTATALIILYYGVFYMAYFRRLLRQKGGVKG